MLVDSNVKFASNVKWWKMLRWLKYVKVSIKQPVLSIPCSLEKRDSARPRDSQIARFTPGPWLPVEPHKK